MFIRPYQTSKVNQVFSLISSNKGRNAKDSSPINEDESCLVAGIRPRRTKGSNYTAYGLTTPLAWQASEPKWVCEGFFGNCWILNSLLKDDHLLSTTKAWIIQELHQRFWMRVLAGEIPIAKGQYLQTYIWVYRKYRRSKQHVNHEKWY